MLCSCECCAGLAPLRRPYWLCHTIMIVGAYLPTASASRSEVDAIFQPLPAGSCSEGWLALYLANVFSIWKREENKYIKRRNACMPMEKKLFYSSASHACCSASLLSHGGGLQQCQGFFFSCFWHKQEHMPMTWVWTSPALATLPGSGKGTYFCLPLLLLAVFTKQALGFHRGWISWGSQQDACFAWMTQTPGPGWEGKTLLMITHTGKRKIFTCTYLHLHRYIS